MFDTVGYLSQSRWPGSQFKPIAAVPADTEPAAFGRLSIYKMRVLLSSLVLPALLFLAPGIAPAQDRISVGWASVDITPDRPVALAGQMHTRISKSVHDPLTATALALETPSDQAVMISVDFAGRSGILEPVRERVKARLRDFDPDKLLLHGTHTHTAPETQEGIYVLPAEGVMPIAEYREFLIARLADAAVRAWENRKPGGVSWGLGFAEVARNRRAVYADGKTIMYGKTDRVDFSHVEGYEDHAVDLLYFWNEGKLTGVAINLSCPSQEVEGQYYVSADFWGDVRTELRKRHGPGLFVYPMTGAAGDQSPHLLFRQRAEETMLRRRGLTRTQEIARRIANAVDDVIEPARRDIRTSLPFHHRVERMRLPLRRITEADYETNQREYERQLKLPETDRTRQFHLYLRKRVLDNWERQKHDPYYPIETHIIRLGDIAIATNPFELYLDYGVRIEARSKAEQTLVVQLACGAGGYLPTARAIVGGSYGAGVENGPVGPEGGQALVERTVELINGLWDQR
jgi:hypothetical protein